MATLKAFRLSDAELERFNDLKVKTNTTSDIDFFRKMLNCMEVNYSKQLVPADLLAEKDEKLNKLFFEFGRLQGVLSEKESFLRDKEELLKQKEKLVEELQKEKESLVNSVQEEIKEMGVFKRIFWAISLKSRFL